MSFAQNAVCNYMWIFAFLFAVTCLSYFYEMTPYSPQIKLNNVISFFDV